MNTPFSLNPRSSELQNKIASLTKKGPLDLKRCAEIHAEFSMAKERDGQGWIEKELSDLIKLGFSKNPQDPSLLHDLGELKKILKAPILVVLSGLPIDDKSLEPLTQIPIRDLHLIACPNLTSSVTRILAKIPSLQSLDVGANDWVDDAFLANLPPSVEELSIFNCKKVTGKGLQALQKSHVKQLNLFACNHFTDQDLAELPEKLEELDLNLVKTLGKKFAEKLGKMKQLKKLNLAGSYFPPELFQYLPPSLIELDINGCKIEEPAFKNLKKLTSLKKLLCMSTPIQDSWTAYFPDSIEEIHMDRSLAITDNGIKALASLPRLRYVGLMSCPEITEKSLTLLKKEVIVSWKKTLAQELKEASAI